MKRKLKISYNSPVILTFTLICLIVTILGCLTNDYITNLLFVNYRGSLKNPLTYFRAFSHVFGHSGFGHFISNAMYLLLLGPMLEEKYGSKVIVEIFAITAFVTGIIHIVFWGNVGLCGASGIVFALIVLSSFTAFKDGEIPLSFILVATLFIGQEIYSGVFLVDNVSNLTHVIGGLVGSVLGYQLNKKKKLY